MHSVEAYLSERKFKLDKSLDHKELIAFVAEYIHKKNRIMRGFWISNLAFLILLVVAIVRFIIVYDGAFSTVLLSFLLGFALTVLLVPVHELLHGIAYKSCGATKVTYRANWKKLYFMAVADMFITSRRQFYFIGLLPFIIISLALIILATGALPAWRITWLSVLVIHTTMCIGDFGLMSYFAENKNKEIITFDNVDIAVSYFYSKNRENTEKANKQLP